MKINKKITVPAVCALLFCLVLIPGCGPDSLSQPETRTVPHEGQWGIYGLDIESGDVRLIYSSPDELYASALRLSNDGTKLTFAGKSGGQDNSSMEIFILDTDGNNPIQITDNDFFDLYPAWSPDDSRIAFLSWRETDLDIYAMNADGSGEKKIHDSGYHDADIDWAGNNIVFTSQFAIWKVNSDGTQAVQVTDYPEQGEWGIANLPAGDYDPRLNPEGNKIVFERLEDTANPNGGYNIFTINTDGSEETRLTDTSYSQGLANWSHSGNRLVFMVGAIENAGKYDIYMMNADGTENRSITPDYFPDIFLCHAPGFSMDDSEILFIGQWWE
ncbi:TolB family protein [Chloroflexota bacterium]